MPEQSDWQSRIRLPSRRDLVLVGLSVLAGVCVSVALGSADAPDPASSTTNSTPERTAAADAAEETVEGLAATPEAEVAEVTAPEPPPGRIVVGKIAPGATLAQSLRQQGVGSGVIARIAREMATHFDFRRSRPGHKYHLTLDAEGKLSRFRYAISNEDGFVLSVEDGRYEVVRDRAELVPRSARIAGHVTTSLYASIRGLGEDPQLAHDFADIFAWDVDFSRSARSGDSYRMLYERLYRTQEDGTEVYVRPGRILAASYQGPVGDLTAVYFEPVPGRGGYYRPDGSSVEREILIAPLRYARISSRYAPARRHPILKITRPHHGIDYAAPSGTPIWAVADGTVIYRGWAGGFGNLVKIRHPKGYVSYYAHLSRFPAGLKVGDVVQQKQMIGYVGQTGLATGPHVCFRIAKDGKYVDPARLRTPAGPPVSPTLQHVFISTRDVLLAEMEAGPELATTDEAL